MLVQKEPRNGNASPHQPRCRHPPGGVLWVHASHRNICESEHFFSYSLDRGFLLPLLRKEQVMKVCHSSPHSLAAPSYGKKNDSSDWRMDRDSHDSEYNPCCSGKYGPWMDGLSPLKIFIFSIQVSPLSLHPASRRQN